MVWFIGFTMGANPGKFIKFWAIGRIVINGNFFFFFGKIQPRYGCLTLEKVAWTWISGWPPFQNLNIKLPIFRVHLKKKSNFLLKKGEFSLKFDKIYTKKLMTSYFGKFTPKKAHFWIPRIQHSDSFFLRNPRTVPPPRFRSTLGSYPSL